MSTGSEPAGLRRRATRAGDRGRSWYRGDCHVHSARSAGGELTPAELGAAARAAGLDFVAVTEHNTADTHDAWNSVAGDDLLVILGQEVVTPHGHWLALGLRPGGAVPPRTDPIEVSRSIGALHEAGGMAVIAHPHAPYPSGTFDIAEDPFDAVELWNGLWTSDLAWNADNEAALRHWVRGLDAHAGGEGWRPAIGNSDTHLDGQIGRPHTVVLANELTPSAILGGLRAGRSWIAESPGIDLSIEVLAGDRRAGIGDTLRPQEAPFVVRVVVRGVRSGIVTVRSDGGELHRASLPAAGSRDIEWRLTGEVTRFVRVEVRHPDGRMAALTNPIFLGS